MSEHHQKTAFYTYLTPHPGEQGDKIGPSWNITLSAAPLEAAMVLTDAVAAWKFVDSRKLVFNADTRIVGTMDDIPLACLLQPARLGAEFGSGISALIHTTHSHTYTYTGS